MEDDDLTKLYNHRVLVRKVKKLRAPPFSLIQLNINNFKRINTTFGYHYGDAILREFGQRIDQTQVIENTLAVRFSADNFIVIIETTDPIKLTLYAKRLLEYIERPYKESSNTLTLSTAAGITPFDEKISFDGHTQFDTLLAISEHCILLAKENNVPRHFFSEGTFNQLAQKQKHSEALITALAKNEFNLVYQPQLDLNKKLVGVEALIHWHHPEFGNIGPNKFIPLAESLNLMNTLGDFIRSTELQDISTLQNKLKCSFPLSINISVQQIMQENFFESILALNDAFKSKYLTLILEVTESLFIENLELLLPQFKLLKDKGILLSLDDFGTGCSSLNMLKMLPVEELKIDKSFLDNITTNHLDYSLLHTIITLGNQLGMKVVAERGETKEQLAILENAQCDILQGYYFSKPMNIDDLECYIQRNGQ